MAAICACKGIRSCNLCEPNKETPIDEHDIVFIYCDSCRQAIRMDIYESNSTCPHHDQIGNEDIALPLHGIYLVPNFLDENEENELIRSIDDDVWIPSQSGRLKQDFGIKINFKKQTIKTKYFTGMPFYSLPLLQRIQSHRLLNDFQSVELCNLDYRADRGSHIDPHIDDTWIWGERLITINLLSDTILTLIPNENSAKKKIFVPLPRRWLIVLYDDARYEYKHAIQRQHIAERRLAVTFRELTGKNEKFYEENKDLYEKILRIGCRFTGISVGRFEQLVQQYQSMKFDRSTTEKSSLKTFSSSLIHFDQLQSILSSSNEIDGSFLSSSTDEIHQFQIHSIKSIGRFLAQWRLATRSFSSATMIDREWWDVLYAKIIEEKKPSYPLLLSNLYTCEDLIVTRAEDRWEKGLTWMTNQINNYLLDLALALLPQSQSIEQMKEILSDYEEILPLTDEEWNHLDIFLRLALIIDDASNENEKALEFFSSNVFFLRDHRK